MFHSMAITSLFNSRMMFRKDLYSETCPYSFFDAKVEVFYLKLSGHLESYDLGMKLYSCFRRKSLFYSC